MKLKLLKVIAEKIAAEQRTPVAHSASYGKTCCDVFQAPAGAIEIIFRAIRRLNILRFDSHSVSYGFNRPQISKAPAGAEENRAAKINFFRPIRGLNHFDHSVPTIGIVGYYRSLLRSFDLWLTPLPIC